MGFAALASGVTHWEQIVQWVQHPEALQAVLTAGNLPWMQVRREIGEAVVGRKGWAAAAAWGRAREPHPARAHRRCAPAHDVPPCLPVALPLPLPLGPHPRLTNSPPSPAAQVLYCGLLTTDLALLLEIVALQSVSSVDAAIIYTLEVGAPPLPRRRRRRRRSCRCWSCCCCWCRFWWRWCCHRGCRHRCRCRCQSSSDPAAAQSVLHTPCTADASPLFPPSSPPQPVLGASFAWALLGERLGAKGMLGAGIIVVSSLATQLLGGNGDKEPGSESDSADEAVGSAAALLKED